MSKRGTTIAAVVSCCFVLGAATAFAAVERIDGPATVASSADRLASPRPGNPGGVPLPPEAAPADTSHPDRVIGSGTPASCTSQAVVAAVAAGGVITFDCGPDPVTIVMTATAKVVNTSPVVVLDGGGKVTLSGAGQRRILYMNTCDPAQIWTTSHCQNQDHPSLTIQNLHFTQGNSTGETYEGGGGGAVFVRGGRVKVIDSFFTANRCDATGPDLGGAALRVLSQFDGLPVIVAGSTFGGSPANGNTCSNGAALSSIGVSWQIYNSVFTDNTAIGSGANPSTAGNAGRREWRGDLSRRQPFHARPGGQHHSRQHGQRRRRCDLLRLEQPHRRTADQHVGAGAQPESRIRDGGIPGDLLPRARRPAGDQLDDQLTGSAP